METPQVAATSRPRLMNPAKLGFCMSWQKQELCDLSAEQHSLVGGVEIKIALAQEDNCDTSHVADSTAAGAPASSTRTATKSISTTDDFISITN